MANSYEGVACRPTWQSACVFMILARTFLVITALSDNMGTEFIIGYISNYANTNISVYLTTNYHSNITVNIQAGYDVDMEDMNVIVAPYAITRVDLPSSIVMVDNMVEKRGLRLHSNQEFIVYGSNSAQGTSDAFLGLPVDVLGTHYITGSYEACISVAKLRGEIGIIGVHDNTTINIIGPQFKPLNADLQKFANFTLNRMETIQLSDFDVTGYQVLSSKSVAVMSGNICSYVPCGYSACDHLVEQMFPIEKWGYRFGTVPSAERLSGDVFRIVASRDDTAVDVYYFDVPETHYLQATEKVEMTIKSDQLVYIESNFPIMVLQFAQSSSTDNLDTDPFMMVLPPIEQYSARYTIATIDTESDYRNYINVIVKKADVGGLRIDGGTIEEKTITGSVNWRDIPTTDLVGGQIQVSSGSHVIEHLSPIATFSVFSYGWGTSVSYGYPGGMRMAVLDRDKCVKSPGGKTDGEDNDCDGKIDEELLNHIDDDNDGLIDEDVAAIPPNLYVPSDVVICSSSNSSVNHSSGVATAWQHEHCRNLGDYTISYTDVASGTVCSTNTLRTHRVIDGCGTVIDGIQRITEYHGLDNLPSKDWSVCFATIVESGCKGLEEWTDENSGFTTTTLSTTTTTSAQTTTSTTLEQTTEDLQETTDGVTGVNNTGVMDIDGYGSNGTIGDGDFGQGGDGGEDEGANQGSYDATSAMYELYSQYGDVSGGTGADGSGGSTGSQLGEGAGLTSVNNSLNEYTTVSNGDGYDIYGNSSANVTAGGSAGPGVEKQNGSLDDATLGVTDQKPDSSGGNNDNHGFTGTSETSPGSDRGSTSGWGDSWSSTDANSEGGGYGVTGANAGTGSSSSESSDGANTGTSTDGTENGSSTGSLGTTKSLNGGLGGGDGAIEGGGGGGGGGDGGGDGDDNGGDSDHTTGANGGANSVGAGGDGEGLDGGGKNSDDQSNIVLNEDTNIIRDVIKTGIDQTDLNFNSTSNSESDSPIVDPNVILLVVGIFAGVLILVGAAFCLAMLYKNSRKNRVSQEPNGKRRNSTAPKEYPTRTHLI